LIEINADCRTLQGPLIPIRFRGKVDIRDAAIKKTPDDTGALSFIWLRSLR
jgi:hypothetical protein